jgi:FkbH-like protein
MISKAKSYLEMVKIGSNLGPNNNNLPEIKIALLADNATQQFVMVLKAAMLSKGFYPNVYEAEYDSIPLEIYNPESNLFSFNPDYVLLHLSSLAYRSRFYNTCVEQKNNLPSKYADEVSSYIKKLTEKNYEVIVNNLSIPHERFFGNYSIHTPYSLYGSVMEVNSLFQQLVNNTIGCHLNDVMFMASQIGIDNWYEEKLWTLYKYMCAPRYFPKIVSSIANIISVAKGKLTKCLVLDLDNTLWGGVIGDNGLSGIEIGELGIGKAYEQFQKYLLELKNRGYILAVCSKNEHANAIQPFKEHPNMILKEKDFAVFVANWNNKGSNIKYIANILNIGLGSIVFVDDSPFERNQVRDMLPQVIVPEIPEDPSEYVAYMENSGLFEAVTFSEDDRRRSEMYREQTLRKNEELKYEDIDDYLKSLDMQISLKRFDEFNLPRIAQLLQRSNQFNLRTMRYSEQNCKDFMKNEKQCYPLYLELRDKLGNYGLISVICTEKDKDTLTILEYVMSCRVLNRGVEKFAMNHLVNYCKEKGLKKIKGEYISSPKNMMVEDFYKKFGFRLISENGKKRTWELEVDNYNEIDTFLKEED